MNEENTKVEDATTAPLDTTLSDNILDHVATLVSILKRTPDMKISPAEVYNMFYIVMPLFRDKELFDKVFTEYYNESHPGGKVIKATVKTLLIKYKDTFDVREYDYLTGEEFKIVLDQGLVEREDYQTYTGSETPMPQEPFTVNMDPAMAMKNGLDPNKFNNIVIDPSKVEKINIDETTAQEIIIDPKDIQTVNGSDTSDVINTAINEELNKDK